MLITIQLVFEAHWLRMPVTLACTTTEYQEENGRTSINLFNSVQLSVRQEVFEKNQSFCKPQVFTSYILYEKLMFLKHAIVVTYYVKSLLGKLKYFYAADAAILPLSAFVLENWCVYEKIWLQKFFSQPEIVPFLETIKL